MNSAEVAFAMKYQINPIVLVGGIAANASGGALSILSLVNPGQYPTGPTSTTTPDTTESFLNQFFGHFDPLPSATLIDNEVAKVPFANQTVAGNAIIADPLRVSLRWVCPVTSVGNYAAKAATIAALQQSLYQHTQLGGLFNVDTPAYLWPNCVLLRLASVDSGSSRQTQYIWQWDFEQPLVTLQSAQQSYSASMGKMAAAAPMTGDPPQITGSAPNVGTNASLAGQTQQPAQSTAGAATANQPGPIINNPDSGSF